MSLVATAGLALAVALCFVGCRRETPLEARLRAVADRVGGRVGVAVLLEGRPCVTLDGEGRYPLMSVMKLPQAPAVADALARRGETTLSAPVRVAPPELLPNTYSPLREAHPLGGDFTVGELLAYTLQLSDNNACDILFARFGGPAATEAYLRRLGIAGCAIAATEDEMHRSAEALRRNWATPLAAARVADLLVARPDLLPAPMLRQLRHLMETCGTGANRLPAPLRDRGVTLGHKTGTGDPTPEGLQTGVNDVGYALLPDGRRYAIAVLIADAPAPLAACEAAIAEISALAPAAR